MPVPGKLFRSIQYQMIKRLLPVMRSWEENVLNQTGALKGNENSPTRFNIPAEAVKLKGNHPPLPGFPRSIPFMFSSMMNMRKSIIELEKNPANPEKTISESLFKELKIFSEEVGVNEIGFTSIDLNNVYSDTAVLHNQAIVLIMEMDKERMSKAPNPDTAVMVHETYDALGQASNKIANWLREHGFSAHAGHPLGGMALYPPMAQEAGLGFRSISGLLITPQFGPRVRIAAVFTNIENLPIKHETEHNWVLDYCEVCKRCLSACPPNAILRESIPHPNGTITTVDTKKCFPYFIKNHGCSICIKICPFNNIPFDVLHKKLRTIKSKTK